MNPITKTDLDALIRSWKLRAKQAELEAEAREKVLLAEVQDQLTAEFDAHDALWAGAVVIAEQAVEKANAQIAAQCLDLGIPAKEARRIVTGWRSRGPSYSNPTRRAEIRKLAETRLTALTKTAKTAIHAVAREAEIALLANGLASDEARRLAASISTVEELMPALSLDDLGVKRWQPPEGVAAALTTPLTPAQRKRRRVLRAMEANPDVSDRAVAKIAGVDHKTVANVRRERGELPAIGGEIPTAEG